VPAIQYSHCGDVNTSFQDGLSLVLAMGSIKPVSTLERKMSRGRLQLQGRSSGRRLYVWQNSERKQCVKIIGGKIINKSGDVCFRKERQPCGVCSPGMGSGHN